MQGCGSAPCACPDGELCVTGVAGTALTKSACVPALADAMDGHVCVTIADATSTRCVLSTAPSNTRTANACSSVAPQATTRRVRPEAIRIALTLHFSRRRRVCRRVHDVGRLPSGRRLRVLRRWWCDRQVLPSPRIGDACAIPLTAATRWCGRVKPAPRGRWLARSPDRSDPGCLDRLRRWLERMLGRSCGSGTYVSIAVRASGARAPAAPATQCVDIDPGALTTGGCVPP